MTGGHMDKRRLRLDTACQLGLSSHLTNLLTVVLMVSVGDKVVGAEFRKSEPAEMFSMVERQPVVVWTNRGHSWIQRVE